MCAVLEWNQRKVFKARFVNTATATVVIKGSKSKVFKTVRSVRNSKVQFEHKGSTKRTRPSILCVTHQMKLFSWLNWALRDDELYVVLDGTGSVYDNTGWYLVSIGWYCLVLGGTGSAKGLNACIFWKKWRFGRVTPMPDTHTDRHQNIGLLSCSPV